MKTAFILISILIAVAAIGSAASLLLTPSALTGQPDDITGWGFTITENLDWIVITNASFVLDGGVLPVGVFTPFISNAFAVVGPDRGNGEVNPWTQTFDNALQTGIGSY